MGRRSLRWAVAGTVLALSTPVIAAEQKPIDVRNLSCKDFLALPDDIRPVVVAWVHGYTRAGAVDWLLDPESVRAFLASVQRRCEKSPQGSFRYQVMETAKERKAAAGK
jgi:HdeA/HdeB family